MSKLLFSRNTDKARGITGRLASLMKPVHFDSGDQLVENGANDTLYAVKEGNIQITSDKNENFILGPGDFIGKKALMGCGGKEPTVASIKGLTNGTVYSIDRADVDKVLGKNYLSTLNSRSQDKSKLVRTTCRKTVHGRPLSLCIQPVYVEQERPSSLTLCFVAALTNLLCSRPCSCCAVALKSEKGGL
jgi:CRP-like cAMP-binding protein